MCYKILDVLGLFSNYKDTTQLERYRGYKMAGNINSNK
jgi:hypothetical protein